MKYFYFIFLLTVPFLSQAQCLADAGPDQHICSSFLSPNGDTLQLGGQPTASGGTAPYTYSWSFHDSIGANIHVYASDFLNDTAIANPELSMSWENDMTYILKVTDANNQVCYDTVVITSSIFVGHLGQYGMTVNAGDTITFLFGTNISSNRPVKSYLWRPNHGMIDSTSENPTVAPTRSTAYHVVITDSAGCSATGGDYVFVTVNHVGLEEDYSLKEIEIYPNPVRGRLHISLPRELADETLVFVLSDATGKVVESFHNYSNEEIEAEITLPDGLFLLKIFRDAQLLAMRKVVVRN